MTVRGAVAARPVHPECPDASSGCIEGPAQPIVWGGADAGIGDRAARPLRYAPVKAPALLRVSGLGRSPIVFATGRACNFWTITVHACYSTRVIPTPDAPTIHSSLSTMEHPCPILFRPVPPQIRHVEHLVFHFSAKCSIAQIGMEHFGTQWNSSHGKSTAQRPNYPLSHYSYRPLHSAPGRSRTSRRGITAGRRRCPPSRTARCRPSRRPGRRTWTPRLGHEARRPSAAAARR